MQKKNSKIFYGILGIIVIVLVLWLVFKPSANYVPLQKFENIRGNASAKLMVIEYSDFECPSCIKFAKEVEPSIKEAYVDTGKVQWVYRHFPLTQAHEFAEKAAEASECAADQGKFWGYHDILFSSGNLDVKSLKQYAKDLGLDSLKFDSCLDSGAMKTRVKEDYNKGMKDGVKGTPTFFVNGIKVEGGRSFSVFKQLIDEELKK